MAPNPPASEVGGVTIRPATAADVPAVLPFAASTVAFHERLDAARFGALPHPSERYDIWLRRLAADEQGVFLVAEAADVGLVGFIIGVMQDEVPIYRVRRIGFLHDLWVDERWRRQGVARTLVTRATERFRELGANQVRLDTAVGNKPAQSLFAVCGFRPAVIEMLLELQPSAPD